MAAKQIACNINMARPKLVCSNSLLQIKGTYLQRKEFLQNPGGNPTRLDIV